MTLNHDVLRNLSLTIHLNETEYVYFLNIPPPSCPPPPQSSTIPTSATKSEMRGPPPQWNPPLPPSLINKSTSPEAEESQYEEAEVSDDQPVHHHDHENSFNGAIPIANISGGNASIASRTTVPPPFGVMSNNYEISTSQQRNTAARAARLEAPRDRNSSPWDDETRQMLVQNPETGSFYVPTGSGKSFDLFTPFKEKSS
ncbi:unnamed protein product [Anisakis simplex]|uniref:Uncharacterized protein n=1 Tax=Anisakis simplex TaxID=6269 RepID=A0A0M3JWN4_ANISI|nr:unnamed protein product [Anisakis simplex]